MIIAASQLNLSATTSRYQAVSREETLRAWIGNERPDFEGAQRRVDAGVFASASAFRVSIDVVSVSAAAREAQTSSATKPPSDEELSMGSKEQVNKLLIEKMMEMMTGKKVRITTIKLSSEAAAEPPKGPSDGNAPAPEAPPARAGYGIEYDMKETRVDSETLRFAAEGSVVTADGRTIDFKLKTMLSRESVEELSVSIREGDAKVVDPLMLDFSGTASRLGDGTFVFDMNVDGVAENVAAPSAGSAILALDRNGDGKIDNGGELFGPTSGDGFSELAALDGDGNGWIDEADASFSSLLLFTPGADGGTVQTLKERNVGALSLGNVQGEFTFKDSANQTTGVMRRAGVFLSEDGTAGMLRQVDLAV